MKILKEYKGTVSLLITSTIIFIQSLLFYLTWNLIYNDTMRYSPFYNKGLILLVAIYVLMYVAFSNIYGGFKIGHFRVSDVIYSQLLSILFVNAITYAEVSLMDRRLLNPAAFIIMTMLQIIISIIWSYFSNRFYYKIFPPMDIIIVYGNENVNTFINKMNKRWDKYKICKLVNIKDGYEAVMSEINGYDAVVIYDVVSNLRNKILKECYKRSISVYVTPKISDIIIGSSDSVHLFDTPLLLSKNTGMSYEQAFFKRVIDILISFILVIITSPIMVIISILIKLSDGGPILFRQNRLTINNKVFVIYKFRSMVVDAEKDGIPRLTIKKDDRITNVGRIIRKIRFDELPQLFNVLKGDMSLVGPRPERPEIAKEYIEIVPEFDFRTKVKAGLTGYAQIMGKYNTTAYDKLKLDMMYIEKFSLILDFKILLMTFKYVFTPSSEESTEGFDKNEMFAEADYECSITQKD
ncbi:MAG: sugar transferase [Tissierellia bacterium]|nr:sugar transferase [Tissierellia bacterium]